MKNRYKLFSAIGVTALMASAAFAQTDSKIQNYRLPGYDGLNVFEAPKESQPEFDGLKVRIGGDFALQFQGINHSNALGQPGVDTLVNLGSNFNLPTANLNLDVQLTDGMRMHLRTYLSSRHHPEAYVKGGYLQMDNLNFIKEGFLSGLMDITTIKIGMDELNYGDAHFRRSDNASAIYNPFVGNYIMDAFTTEAFFELMFRPKDFIAMVGISNGNLNQSVVVPEDSPRDASFYGKLGWDSQLSEDLRVRITGSAYISPGYNNGNWMYSGDRAGARYYSVMSTPGSSPTSDFRTGRFSPGFTKYNSFQLNPFVKWKGLEFFGVFEFVGGDLDDNDLEIDGKKVFQGGSVTQIGAEVLYRFGSWDQFYVGGRFNNVGGKTSEIGDDLAINRINAGLGWFMTKNVMAKLEYVSQTYSGDHWLRSKYQDGKFDGVVFEAVIGF